LSIFARRGSGSAARSIFGGFVEMRAGVRADGSDSYAEQLLEPTAWPLHVVVAITSRDRKQTSSTRGMQSTAATSPYYAAWLASSADDLAAARSAIHARDFAALGATAEHSCLKMHALAMSGTPPLVYWNAATLACMNAVRELARDGVGVFFTIDAGPQLKAVCEPGSAATVAAALRDVPGVVDVLDTGLGAGA